jgi:predicted permease
MSRSVIREVRYSLRNIRLSPLFTITVVLTLGLGMGATAAIFSLIYTVMLKPLPVPDPGSLYRLGTGKTCCYSNDLQGEWGIFSYDFYQRLRRSTPQFEQVAAFQAEPHILSVRYGSHVGQAQALLGEYVSGNYFQTLGVQPFAGRLFTFADDERNSEPVAVMSYRTWQDKFGGDLSVVNADFTFEGFNFKVVGITPPNFYGETMSNIPPSLWIPLQTEYLTDAEASYNLVPSSAWLRVIGRLRPGAQVGGASSELTSFLRHWLVSDADIMPNRRSELEQQLPRQRIEIERCATGIGALGDEYGRSLKILLAVCAMVLLIACANVVNLQLARGMTRRVQVSIQSALGASGAQLIRQALIESLILALLGGIAGVCLAIAGVHLVVKLAFGPGNGIAMHVGLSWPMLGFCAALTLASAVSFGSVPAWLLARTNPIEAMRAAGRASADTQPHLRKILVVLQVAASTSLLAGASLLTRSLLNIEQQDFGFTTQDRIVLRMEEPLAAYSHEHLNVLYRQLQDALERLPGVRSASLALYSPFTAHWDQLVVKPGEGMPSTDGSRKVLWDRVSPRYFATLGQELLAGREFTEADNATSRQVAIVNQSFVRRYFSGIDPLGKVFGFSTPANSEDFAIVGVVRDAKYTNPEEAPEPMVFAPLAQHSNYSDASAKDNEKWSHFITGAQLWIDGNPGRLDPQIRDVFREVDPNFAIVSIQPLQQQIDTNFDERRLLVRLCGLFSVLSLILASVGLYGITAYNVASRTREIGVRMAVGADRARIALFVLQAAFAQTLLGLVMGLPVALMIGRSLKSRLYEVGTIDAPSILLPAAALLLCAGAASLLPAMRAASIQPIEALRSE